MKTQLCTFSLFVILICSCEKDPVTKSSVTKQYTVKGRLLESSSNPTPVAYLKLTVSQSSTSSLLIGGYIGGILKDIKTNESGYFEFNYETGTLLFMNDNYKPISLYAKDTTRYGNIQFQWSQLRSNIDTNLNTLYLFKKINTLIRKVQFVTSLQAGDSLQISSTEQLNKSIVKTIHGPVSAGSVFYLDTSYNYRFSNYNIKTSGYSFTTTLSTKKSYRDTIIQLSKNDELSKEFVFVY